MKKLYIFNKQDGTQSADFYESEITENVLWAGESWEALKEETGLSEAELGGLVKLKNGKLGFDIVLKAEAVRKAKEALIPLAMGNDLVKFVNQQTESQLDDLKAFDIVSKLKDFLLYCQQGRCNPFSRKTFDTTLSTLDKVFTNGDKKLIIALINNWAKTVRFE